MQEFEQKLKWSHDLLQAIKMQQTHEVAQLLEQKNHLDSQTIATKTYFDEALILNESLDEPSILNLLANHFSLTPDEIIDLVWISLFGQELDTIEKRKVLKFRHEYTPATHTLGANYFNSFQFLIGRYFSVELANRVIEQIVLFEPHKENALIYLLDTFQKYNLLEKIDQLLIIQAYSIYQFKSFSVLSRYFPLFELIDDTRLVYYMGYVASRKDRKAMLELIHLFVDFKVSPQSLRMRCFHADTTYLEPLDHFYDSFNEFLALYDCYLSELPMLTDIIETRHHDVKHDTYIQNDEEIQNIQSLLNTI